MYCPRCATQNIDSARFCRSCGANLSLVPQALSGQLPEDPSDKAARAIKAAIKRRREPNLARGIRKTSVGLAFLVMLASFSLTRSSVGVGMIWLLIPAFLFLGKGIGEIITAISADRAARQIARPPATLRTNELPPHPIYDTVAPPSVTENTTRHLETDPPPQSRETT
jgi:hypothetical protein